MSILIGLISYSRDEVTPTTYTGIEHKMYTIQCIFTSVFNTETFTGVLYIVPDLL